ncbi:MAG: EAL domain-containing protein [Pseudomonas sp.]
MSLVKQLLLAICLFLLVAFSGSFVVSVENSREQLQSQLRSHAQDAATALGLSLKPYVDDPAMQQLMVSSIFDSGYFASIRLVSVQNDEVLVERIRSLEESEAPAWFASLVNLQAQGGDAIVMSGWQQFARVEVISHPQFALDKLWSSATGMLMWLLICGLVSAVLGGMLLKRQLQPLMDMAGQAEAITRREYRTLPRVPKTMELRHVVLAMNQMVAKLRSLFEEEAAKTEHFRRQAYHDALTDLPNRLALEHGLSSALTSDEDPAGYVLAIRVPNLQDINQAQGAAVADALLRTLAEPLKRVQKEHPSWLAARSRGGEFLLLAPMAELQDVEELAAQVSSLAMSARPQETSEEPLDMGIAHYRVGDQAGLVFARVDQALAQSSMQGQQIEPGYCLEGLGNQLNSAHDWRMMLEACLKGRNFVLHFQPALDTRTPAQVFNNKLLVRMPDGQGGLINAGQFLPWIERLDMAQAFDECMLELAMAHLAKHPTPLALSITSQSLNLGEGRQRLLRRLAQQRPLAALLTLEVDARYLQDTKQLALLANDLKLCGSRLALQHFGRRLSLIGELALIGLDYLKIDSSFIRNIDTEEQKHLYLETLMKTAQRIDVQLVAEQVQTPAEIKALETMGIYIMQGHALKEPGPWTE